MIIIYFVLIPVGLAIGAYLYFYVKRMLTTLGAPTENRRIKLICAAAALCLGLFAMNISIGIIAVGYLAAFVGIFQLLNFIIKLVARKRYVDDCGLWKKVYGIGVLPFVCTLAVVIGGIINLNTVVKTEYTVYTDKVIREEGYRVVFISDVHFGITLDYEELLEKCEEISREEPDVVVLGGDIVDNSTTAEQMRQVFKAFGTVKSEFGVYFVYGNHDRSMRMVDNGFTDDELREAITESDIKILRDETLQLTDDFLLVGRDDDGMRRKERSRKSIDELIADVDKSDYMLVLDHQPCEYAENGKAKTDLILSGHTHGGNFFPINIVFDVFGINDGVYGQYEITDDTKAIVSSGFANWGFSAKTGVPSEYVVVNIKPN